MVKKTLLTGGTAAALLLAGSVPGLAQNQQQSSQTEQSSQAESQQSQTQPSQVEPAQDVSSAELDQFAQALQKIRQIQKQTQQKRLKAIERSELNQQKFFAILKSKQSKSQFQDSSSGQSQAEPDATQAEMQEFRRVSQKLMQLQKQANSQKQQAVEQVGLNRQRFNRILAALKQDTELRKRLQQTMQDSQGS
ncbi:MAG: hypothetical protein BRC58_00980 [Cyanobacteria bacterium QS_8_64_29]|nr:MAG: hypothetical protein BRC58_00980 [Cyanobacteria bacterium QS_8_64_29]